jgi:copper chaperone CopZ
MVRYSRLICAIAFGALLTGCTSEVTLSVPDMMCEDGCAVKVRKILSEQPGVRRAEVDFPNRTATVRVYPSQFSADAAVAALVDYGFDHSQLKSGASGPASPRAATSIAPPAADASQVPATLIDENH